MKNYILILLLSLLAQTVFSQNISFTLFTAEVRNNTSSNYSFFPSKVKIRSEKVIASYVDATPLDIRKNYKLDSMNLRLITSNSPYLDDSISLVVVPKTDRNYTIENVSVEYHFSKIPEWELTDENNPKNLPVGKFLKPSAPL